MFWVVHSGSVHYYVCKQSAAVPCLRSSSTHASRFEVVNHVKSKSDFSKKNQFWKLPFILYLCLILKYIWWKVQLPLKINKQTAEIFTQRLNGCRFIRFFLSQSKISPRYCFIKGIAVDGESMLHYWWSSLGFFQWATMASPDWSGQTSDDSTQRNRHVEVWVIVRDEPPTECSHTWVYSKRTSL